MQINVYLGLSELFRPFRSLIPAAKFISVRRISTGHEQWVGRCELLDDDMKPIPVSETDELRMLTSLWGEQHFYDWLYNVAGNVVFQNMASDSAIERL